MADVFLSYAREDLPFVRRLTAALQARHRDVWVDLEDIIPSTRWLEEIRTGITEADAVAFVITPDSVVSEVAGPSSTTRPKYRSASSQSSPARPLAEVSRRRWLS